MFTDTSDYLCVGIALLLIVVAVLGFMGIAIPAVEMIVAVLFVIGGIIGLFNGVAHPIYPMYWKLVYFLLFLVVAIMGVNTFFVVPVVGAYLSLVPLAITNVVINAIVAVALFAVAVQTD